MLFYLNKLQTELCILHLCDRCMIVALRSPLSTKNARNRPSGKIFWQKPRGSWLDEHRVADYTTRDFLRMTHITEVRKAFSTAKRRRG